MIVPRKARNSEVARTTLRLAQWGLDNGGATTQAAGFIPVDDKLAFKVKLAWREALVDECGNPLLRR